MNQPDKKTGPSLIALKEAAVSARENNIEKNPSGLKALRGDDGVILEILNEGLERPNSLLINGQAHQIPDGDLIPNLRQLTNHLASQSQALREFIVSNNLLLVESITDGLPADCQFYPVFSKPNSLN